MRKLRTLAALLAALTVLISLSGCRMLAALLERGNEEVPIGSETEVEPESDTPQSDAETTGAGSDLPPESSDPPETDPPQTSAPPIEVSPELEVLSADGSLYRIDLPAGIDECAALLPSGDQPLLVAWGFEISTPLRIYRITPASGEVRAVATVAGAMPMNHETLAPWGDGGFRFADAVSGMYRFYDAEGRLAKTLAIPQGVSNGGYLYENGDQTLLYYIHSSSGALFRHDFGTGTQEKLTDLKGFSYCTVGACMQDGKYLLLSVTESRTDRFLSLTVSCENGEIVYAEPSMGARYYESDGQSLIHDYDGETGAIRLRFGVPGNGYASATILPPSGETFGFITPDLSRRRMVSVNYYETNLLRLYDTERLMPLRVTASDEASFSMDTSQACFASDGRFYLTLGNLMFEPSYVLFLWDTEAAGAADASPIPPGGIAIGSGGTVDSALSSALLAKCDALEEKYGITIAIGNEVDREFPDYRAEVVRNESKISRVLDVLDEALAVYPAGFLSGICTDDAPRFVIYLAGALTATNDFNLSTAGAFYTAYGGETMIVLDMDQGNLLATVHHEISHAIDSMLIERLPYTHEFFTEWGPGDYLYSYSGYDGSYENTFLGETDPEKMYYISDYAKTFPTEDRAILFEYLLWLPDCGAFESPHIRRKLALYFEAIRDAYPIEGAAVWEEKLRNWG